MEHMEQCDAPDEPVADRSALPSTDRGSTFIEVLVTVVLLGVLVIPLLAAVRTSIRASSTSRDAAEIETLLVNVVDRVNRADATSCDFTSQVEAAVETFGWPPGAAAVTHEYLQPDNSWSTAQGPAPCVSQVRLVTVVLTDPESGLTRTIEVVKSNG